MISRRSLLACTAIVPLAGCSNVQNWLTANTPTIDQLIKAVANEANTIVTLLGNALKAAATQGFPGLTSDTLNVVQASMSGVQAVTQSLTGISDAAALQSNVQKIASYAAAALGAMAMVPGLPPPIPAILAGAAILVPTMGTLVSLVLPKPPVPAGAPAVDPVEAHTLAVTTS